MLINLKLASHAFRCGGHQWKFGVQNNIVQSLRHQMTQGNAFSKNALLNQQNRNVSDQSYVSFSIPLVNFSLFQIQFR